MAFFLSTHTAQYVIVYYHTLFVLCVPVFSPRAGAQIQANLKSKISSDIVLNAIPKPKLYPLSFLNCFCNSSTKKINICTAQFSLHKSRLLIGHGSIIFLSALCQFRIKPCIKLYIAWDLAAGRWKVSLELDEVPGPIAVIFMGEQCFVTRALSSGPGYSTNCVTPVLQSRVAD